MHLTMRYNDHNAKLSAREASRSSYGNLNFHRRQFSISVSRRRFTSVVALARLYHYRMIRYTAGVSSIRQFLEIVLVSIEETELINGASLNRTNKVPLSTFRPLIRRKLYVHRDISFCTFVRLPLHESRVIREAIS